MVWGPFVLDPHTNPLVASLPTRGDDVKQKGKFMLPKIGYRALYRAGKRIKLSESQARRTAERIVNAPWWPEARAVLAEGNVLPHRDPTADEAIWNVLTELLAANHAEAVMS